MSKLFILLCLFVTSAMAEDLSHLDEIEKGKVVVGKALKAKDLKGKIVIFKYWGYN